MGEHQKQAQSYSLRGGLGIPTGYHLCFSTGWGVIGLWVGLASVSAVLLVVWTGRLATLAY